MKFCKKVLIVSVLLLLIFTFNSNNYQPIIDLEIKRPRTVVSISTFGGRTQVLSNTIESIYNQSCQVDEIQIHLPLVVNRINAGKIDDSVYELSKKYPNLKFYHPIDYGPSTKLLGSLLVEKDPNTIIITLDDDTSYHKDTVYYLVAHLLKSNQIPCFVCEEWGLWWVSRKRFGICRGWANAFAGVAYKRGWFDSKIFDYKDAPNGCKLHDDVWISGYLFQKNIVPFVLNPGINTVLKHFRHPSLSINSVKNTEKEYRDPCIKYFNYFNK